MGRKPILMSPLDAILRATAPLIRLAIARGITFPALSEGIKALYLAAAERWSRLAESGSRTAGSR